MGTLVLQIGLAEFNIVKAVEPNEEMLEHRICDNFGEGIQMNEQVKIDNTYIIRVSRCLVERKI